MMDEIFDRQAGTRSPRSREWMATLAMAIWLNACGDEGAALPTEPERTAKPVQIEIVSARRYDSFIHVPGLVEAQSSMSLSFRIEGTIAAFVVEEGDYVEQGSVIAELDRRDSVRAAKLARAVLARAKAHAADARRVFEREDRLRSANSTSDARLGRARSAHQMADAEVRQARLELEAAKSAVDDCSLTAPVSGFVERRLLDKHEFATPHRPAVVLTELDTLKVNANVADWVLSALSVGQSASIRSSAWPDRVFPGQITRVAMAADAVTHTLPIEIEIANPDQALRPQMVVEVSLRTGGAQKLLTVPMNAVLRDGAKRTLSFVAVTKDDGTHAGARRVSLGRLVGDRVAILDGLRDGERVIVSGQHFLREGDAVRILDAAIHSSMLEPPP